MISLNTTSSVHLSHSRLGKSRSPSFQTIISGNFSLWLLPELNCSCQQMIDPKWLIVLAEKLTWLPGWGTSAATRQEVKEQWASPSEVGRIGLYLAVSVPCLTGRSNLQSDWAQMLRLLGKENMVIYQFIFRLTWLGLGWSRRHTSGMCPGGCGLWQPWSKLLKSLCIPS